MLASVHTFGLVAVWLKGMQKYCDLIIKLTNYCNLYYQHAMHIQDSYTVTDNCLASYQKMAWHIPVNMA